MRPYWIFAVVTVALAQNIPGLGTDPHKKGPPPPVIKQRVDPPAREDAQAAHDRTLGELDALIAEATALRAELEANGPDRIGKASAGRIDMIRKKLKAVEAGLKRR